MFNKIHMSVNFYSFQSFTIEYILQHLGVFIQCFNCSANYVLNIKHRGSTFYNYILPPPPNMTLILY